MADGIAVAAVPLHNYWILASIFKYYCYIKGSNIILYFFGRKTNKRGTSIFTAAAVCFMRSLSHDKLEVRADGKNENKIGSEK